MCNVPLSNALKARAFSPMAMYLHSESTRKVQEEQEEPSQVNCKNVAKLRIHEVEERNRYEAAPFIAPLTMQV